MAPAFTRRAFVIGAPVCLTALPGVVRGQGAANPRREDGVEGEFPRAQSAWVQAVVGASHFDLAKVKDLV